MKTRSHLGRGIRRAGGVPGGPDGRWGPRVSVRELFEAAISGSWSCFHALMDRKSAWRGVDTAQLRLLRQFPWATLRDRLE